MSNLDKNLKALDWALMARRLMQVRAERKHSFRQVCAKHNVSPSTLSRFEKHAKGESVGLGALEISVVLEIMKYIGDPFELYLPEALRAELKPDAQRPVIEALEPMLLREGKLPQAQCRRLAEIFKSAYQMAEATA